MNTFEVNEWKAFLKPILAPYELDPRVSIYLIGRGAQCAFADRMELHDIDLLIIGENFGEPCSREVVVKDDITYDISYVRAASLRNMVTSRQAMWIEMLAQSKLLLSIGGVAVEPVEKAAHLWEQGPGKPDAGAIKRIRFECGQLLENLEHSRADAVKFSYLMSYSVHRMVELYFELEGRWLPKAKKQMTQLKQLNGDFYDKMAHCLITNDHNEKMASFEDAVSYMLSNYGGAMLGFSKGAYPIDL